MLDAYIIDQIKRREEERQRMERERELRLPLELPIPEEDWPQNDEPKETPRVIILDL